MNEAISAAQAYLTNQAFEQQQMEKRLDKLLPEKDPKDLDRLLEASAISASEQHAERAATLEEEFSQLCIDLRAVRDEAKAGRLTKAEAVKRLAKLRTTHDRLVRESLGLRELVNQNRATLDDPSATRARLMERYGL